MFADAKRPFLGVTGLLTITGRYLSAFGGEAWRRDPSPFYPCRGEHLECLPGGATLSEGLMERSDEE